LVYFLWLTDFFDIFAFLFDHCFLVNFWLLGVVHFKFFIVLLDARYVIDLLQAHDSVSSIFVVQFKDLAGLDLAKLLKHFNKLI